MASDFSLPKEVGVHHAERKHVMTKRALENITIRRSDAPDLRFEGTRLGGGRDPVTSITLYKTRSGKYVVAVDSSNPYSIIEGGARATALIADSLEEIVEKIRKTIGLYNQSVKSAFLEASDVEPTLRSLAIEEI